MIQSESERRDYNDQIYFPNAYSGSQKLVVENFYSKDNAKKESAMVYSLADKETVGSGEGYTLTSQKMSNYNIAYNKIHL